MTTKKVHNFSYKDPIFCQVVCQGVRCNIKIGRNHGDGVNYRGSSARQYCGTHDARWLTHGDVRADDPILIQRERDTKRPPCAAPDCQKEARGWQGSGIYCNAHRLLSDRHVRLHVTRQHNIGVTCSVKGCDKVCERGADKFVKGMCPSCYARVSGKASETQSRRRARKANTECDGHSTDDLHQYWRDRDIDPKRCTYCDAWHTKWKNNWKNSVGDHVYPINKGGTDTMDNLVPCCTSCNSSKGAKILYEEWIPPKEREAS